MTVTLHVRRLTPKGPEAATSGLLWIAAATLSACIDSSRGAPLIADDFL
jgi:hypothetical protein